MNVNKLTATTILGALFLSQTLGASLPPAGPALIAMGSINSAYEDFATQTAGVLENGVPGNRLGGIGSGLAYMGGDYFLGLPDRGPNAVDYEVCKTPVSNKPLLDNTTTYIPRFQTLHMTLAPSDSGPLPFTLTPMVIGTTLLSSHSPLVYGPGCPGDAGYGAPSLNATDHTNYFSGRSDNFDPTKNSLNSKNARFDPESIRLSKNRRKVYITDEYGPYVYEFDRMTGERTKVFSLPSYFAVNTQLAFGDDEIAANTAGRVANKGMEGLAITPDGKMLVGAMQSPLIQDGGDTKGLIIRIVTIEIPSGKMREYGYQLDNSVKTTVSDIVAINDHQFLVDERDGKGRGDNTNAVFKKVFRIDTTGADDISGITGYNNIKTHTLVSKDVTPFLDLVAVLTADYGTPLAQLMTAGDIPAKLEGIAFGQDVMIGGQMKHTFYVGSDNDFLVKAGVKDNPNQIFVFAFDDTELPGFEPQDFKADPDEDGPGPR